MTPIPRYFRDLWLGVTTTLVGMSVTWRHLFKPAVTVQYPYAQLHYPQRARAALVNAIELCNCCQQCARACPVNIITVKTVKALPDEDLGEFPDGKKRRLHILDFTVDMTKCVYCGFCVDACPTEAIHWQAPHQNSVYSRAALFMQWSKMAPEEKQRLLAREAAAKAAKPAAPAHGETPKPVAPETPPQANPPIDSPKEGE
jgi:NADH-quinone oxidoreductase subunit I